MGTNTEQPADSRNIHQRLHAVMEEVDYIQKERKNGMNYTIVSHDAVTAKVRPVLVKHRVIYYPVSIARSQDGNRTQMDVTVRFANVDDPADFIDVACCGYGIDPQDKGPGKATSYAVKYALLKALGLETGDDPDEQNIPHQLESQARAEKAIKQMAADLEAELAEKLPLCTTKEALEDLWRLSELGSKTRDIGNVDKAAKERILAMFSTRKAEILRSGQSEPNTALAAGD